MQQLCYVLNINQSLIPVYHPLANPVERKNRDLKPRLAMMEGNIHTLWNEQLPAIRFAMNTAKCETTGCTAAYMNLARELRTLDEVTTDLRSVIHKDNFVPEYTPNLNNNPIFSGLETSYPTTIRKDAFTSYCQLNY
ncbi:hypothetical protein AVEN_223345-1 [Araneus ventricosus]|uniref:Integrase catalytic domain-containing protein n=1 Tax=Araneus ventricosus TaxID=182803 RepID=A0A4Y2EUX1_ARAVE|nr:hypothetical protein AVEN_223345-1 [Araneus ventricosus]